MPLNYILKKGYFKKYFLNLFIFRDKGMEGEKEGEK